MFEKMTHDDLLNLTSVQEGPCVSIYLPRFNEKTIKIEYEALVRRAAHLLIFDSRKTLREDLLETLSTLNPLEILSSQDQGIAIFVNKHLSSYYLTGHELPSKTVVADSFHLKPLIDDLQGTHTFNILVITQDEAVLLHSDSGRTQETHNFLLHQGQHSNSIHWKHQDDTETIQLPFLQSRTRARGSQDNHFKNRSIKIFLKWIDSKICKDSGFKSTPLFLFTNDLMFKSYKEITGHPQPSHCPLPPSQSLPRIEALVHQAQQQVQKRIAQQQLQSTQTLSELAKRRMIVDDLFKISKAALKGKIRTLYLRDNIEIWGHFRRQSGEITLHEKQLDSKDDDILDDIACEVIRHGGEVMVLTGKEMPTSSPAAAILNI